MGASEVEGARVMIRLVLAWLCVSAGALASQDAPTVLIVVGAPGEEKYGSPFAQWAEVWRQTASKSGAKELVIGLDPAGETHDIDRLKRALSDEPKEAAQELWLVLIGHGTFDGKQAKFNLRGPDFTAAEFAAWLRPFKRPVAVINCASASGPFINELSGPGRVIVTATRSGYEQNYARFGEYIAEALKSPSADLDKDNQVSLLEAFLLAAHRVNEFYAAEGRLATEHALIDDNGDGRGTPADWFRGVRVVKKAAEGGSPDGARAHQWHLIRSDEEQLLSPELRAKRDQLELSLVRLREQKTSLTPDAYLRKLEELMLQLARIYEQTEAK